jgi:hypothetical protein
LLATDADGEATLSYYKSDPKSKIKIIAEGISETGLPLAATLQYEVK